MLLALDVGNTNTVVGLYERDKGAVIRDRWRLQTDVGRTSDEWWLFLNQLMHSSGFDPGALDGVVLASVVPKVTGTLQRACARKGITPLTVSWQTDTGIEILLDDPSELGPDRLANAVGAHDRSTEPTIVVDMGTATTLDVVSAKGQYLGGVILPGMQVSLDALFQRAAALRSIPLVAPEAVVGRNTKQAVQSGATFGYAAQIDGLCLRVQEEVGKCEVVFTGGLSSVIAPLSNCEPAHDPDLTLRGLQVIFERNMS